MPGRLTFTMLDHGSEKTTMSLHTGEVTAVSLPGLLTEVGDLRTAIEGLILGNVHKESLSVFDTVLENDAPADPFAQRETGWLITYEDNLPFFDDPVNAIPNEGFGKKFTLFLGTADLALLPAGDDEVPLNQAQAAAFVSAFEQTARSPYGGTVTVFSIRHVGRNT